MKKVFVSMILAGALFTGSTTYAQTQTDATTGATVQKENTKHGKKDKGVKEAKKGKKEIKMRSDRQRFNPFDGVQLSDDQQQRLQVLQQGLGPVQLSQKQQANIPENKNLTDEQKKQLRQEQQAQRMEKKKNYLNGVKEILTPEQYVIFLENVYLYSPQDQGQGTIRPAVKANRGEKGSKHRMEKKSSDK